jgi:hypothetical protein
MPVLASQQRKTLEDACTKGRRASEQAVRAALTSLAITAGRPPAHLNEDDRQLRRGLRAKAQQLGDEGDDLNLLVAECAYEQWHRLLFARFLAENNLLIHPEYRAPVTLEDCDELAESLGEPDGWSVAARFAAEILPGIFRLDDPCVRLRLAPEGRLALEAILAGLPAEVFAADDALGWVYQFWQKDKKDEVNASERKIGGADLGPVTQLFTENYMVRFLLENSLGAWWASRRPDSPLVKTFEYLRFADEGDPAAGTFDGWPDRVAEVTVMDPCCGSGHFLVEAFSMLWQMRAEEEGLSPIHAQDAVLRDNLFGLELDPRCVQIAMFAVAFHAWKAGGGWRELPVPNIACSGIPVKARVEEWKALAGDDQRLENALVRLHVLFRDADTLGSLIDPRRAAEVADPTGLQLSMADVEWFDIAPLVAAVSRREAADPSTAVLGHDAAGIARATDLLTRSYVLLVTNVPYLSRQLQTQKLRDYLESRFRVARADLATAMLHRCATMARTVASVSPQNWQFLGAYKSFRDEILAKRMLRLTVRLGAGAFEGISGEVVKPVLTVSSVGVDSCSAADLSDLRGAAAKERGLRSAALVQLSQQQLRKGIDHVISLVSTSGTVLSKYAASHQGLITGDNNRFLRNFWEVESADQWTRVVMSPNETSEYTGREWVLDWNPVLERTSSGEALARVQGQGGWGRLGVVVSRVGRLAATLSLGEIVIDKGAAMTPFSSEDVAAVWAFVRSDAYDPAVRAIDAALAVASGTLVKVPFDVEHWRDVAEEAGTLPEPFSDDPTQWLFEGRPLVSTAPLQVAVARLVGYQWPEQPESDNLDGFADADGIVCLPSVAGEPPAADRLQQLLGAAFGPSWSPPKQKELLEATGSKKRNLSEWLRDDFFKQHCALFGHRPFVWHVWDGQRDGFAALLNYHRLDRKTLEKLTYTYLSDWIERQRAEVRDDKAGAEARLAAASTLRSSLALILDGEPPYDIYVRWKSLAEQPIGWEPDDNDGVRVNVRPFVEASVLRSSFNIHWRKDRGKNPDGSERFNHLHFTTAEKREAQDGLA